MGRRRVGREWQSGIKHTNNVADKKLNILVWGEPGTGKTEFMGTAPKPFIIAAEDGTLTLHGKDIVYFPLSDDMKVYDTVMQIIDDARKKVDVFENIETICVDSMWKLNRLILEEIQEEKGTTKGFDIWDALNTRMSKIHSNLLSLNYHYIFSAGEKLKEDKLTEELKPVFNMSGGFATQMAYESDLNFYMTCKTKGTRAVYSAFVLQENKRNAKSRVKLPREIVNLTFDYLWEKINGELEKKDA